MAWLTGGYVAVGAALTVVYYLLPARSADLVVWPIIGWSSVIAIVIGVAFNRPNARLAWYLLAAGVAMQVIGDNLYSVRTLVQDSEVPFPSSIDLAYLSMYPVVIGGVALLVRRRTSGRDRSSLIDVGIITVSLGLLSWVLLIAPYVNSVDLTIPERLISIAYPIADVALLATVARLAVGGGRRTIAYWLLGASILPMVAADAMYSYLSLEGVYTQHSFIEAGWIAFYIGWGAAALHPSMRALSEATPSTPRISAGRLAVIGSAVLVPPVMLLSQGASGDVTDAAAIACAAAILPILVLIRVARLAHDATAARSEARFRTLIDKTSDAIVVVDGKGRIRYHTPSTERMLGRCTSELEGAHLGELLTEPDAMRLLAMFTSDATSATIEWRVRHPDGGWRDLEVTADDLRGMTELDGIVFTMRDVTERKRFDLEFRRQTLHDALTGLANRTLFIDRVDQALKRAKRADGSVVVLFLNLDDFKMVNDSLGHAAGDELLVAVAARLTTTAQTDYGVARLGGDEFGFLIEIADVDGGPELAALGIQAALRAPFRVGGKEMPVHASIGIAVGSPWTHTPDDMLRDADLAMSFAKRKGKDRYELFLPAMHQEATRRLDLAAELQGGIERGEFVVHYQPIVDVGSGHIVGAESLVRWRHPRRGLLDPNEFLPMAEITGLIGPLDLWVLDEACRQATAWTGGGVADDSIFFVSVNLSAQHLQDPNIVQDVVTALETSGLAAGALLLEVTETALISDLDTASTSLASLTQLGVKVAVDDFGTGYTSLPHLVRSPIHVIKIDASLIDLVSDTDGSRMVRAVVDLTHTLGLKAIALGVEHAEQARALQDIDCHLAQGYLFAEPLPPDVMTALLTRQSARRVTSPVDQPA